MRRESRLYLPIILKLLFEVSMFLKNRHVFVAFCSVFFIGRAQAADKTSPSRLQRECFCVQVIKNPNPFGPYNEVVKAETAPAKCSGVQYRPGEWDPAETVLDCPSYRECRNIEEQLSQLCVGEKAADPKCQFRGKCFDIPLSLDGPALSCRSSPNQSKSLCVNAADGTSNKEDFKTALTEAEKNRDEAKKAVAASCGANQNRKGGNQEACQEARKSLQQSQRLADQALIEKREAERTAVQWIEDQKKALELAREKTKSICGNNYRDRSALSKEDCKRAQKRHETALVTLEAVKASRPSGCKDGWDKLGTLNECYLAWRDEVFGPASPKAPAVPASSSQGKEAVEKKGAAKQRFDESRAAADKAIADGTWRDCALSGGKSVCVGRDGAVHLVDSSIRWAWLRSRLGSSSPHVKEGSPQEQPKQQAGWQKADAANVKGIVANVKGGHALVNLMQADLKNTGKWPSHKLNQYDRKNFDAELRAKYDDHLVLMNALRRNSSADPIEVFKSLNLKTNPLEGIYVPASGKAASPAGGSLGPESAPGGKAMIVVDANGKPINQKIKICSKAYGFVSVERNGNVYCQQLVKTAKTVAAVRDAQSATGYKIVSRCAPMEVLLPTEWAGKGSGECGPASLTK
jgi:hypothetical protein